MKQLATTFVVCVLCACSPQPEAAVAPKGSGQPASTGPAIPAPKRLLTFAKTAKTPAAAAAFEKAMDFFDNIRNPEAIDELKKAITAEPDFAYAHAYLGQLTPGMDGQKELEKAAQLAARLPEADRLFIETMLRQHQGDGAAYRAGLQRLTVLVPDEWRPPYLLGTFDYFQQDFAKAVPSLERAITLRPTAVAAHTMLGYAFADQGRYDKAIAAFNRYVQLRPTEPNAHDNLGELYLNAGKLEEARAAFTKASELSPKFTAALGGLAFAHAYRGDYKSAYEALARARKAAPQAEERLDFDRDVAWLKLAEGKRAEASKALDAAEKAALADKVPLAGGLADDRALMFYALGRYGDSAKQWQRVLDGMPASGLAAGAQAATRRWALANLAVAHARAGKVADAEKTLVLVEAEAKKVVDRPYYRKNGLAVARAWVALAKGDPKAAAAGLAECTNDNLWCALDRTVVLEKAGDQAGAVAARKLIVDKPLRDRTWAFVRGKVKQ